MANGRSTAKSKPLPKGSIRSEADLDQAIRLVDSLLDRYSSLSHAEKRTLKMVGELIREYEDIHHPMPEVSPRELLTYLLKLNGLSISQFASTVGIPIGTISAALNGTGQLTDAQSAKIAQRFKLVSDAFVKKSTR